MHKIALICRRKDPLAERKRIFLYLAVNCLPQKGAVDLRQKFAETSAAGSLKVGGLKPFFLRQKVF